MGGDKDTVDQNRQHWLNNFNTPKVKAETFGVNARMTAYYQYQAMPFSLLYATFMTINKTSISKPHNASSFREIILESDHNNGQNYGKHNLKYIFRHTKR